MPRKVSMLQKECFSNIVLQHEMQNEITFDVGEFLVQHAGLGNLPINLEHL